MEAGRRREYVGAALLVLLLGVFAIAIMGWPHGIVTAGLVALALIVARNL